MPAACRRGVSRCPPTPPAQHQPQDARRLPARSFTLLSYEGLDKRGDRCTLFTGGQAYAFGCIMMRIEPYRSDELNYAYCCHVFYRWQSYCRRPNRYLSHINAPRIEAERPDVHILNIEANDFELVLLASLHPTDSIATGASKIKGGARKVSFLPDHVHLAIHTHPSVMPADVVLEFLNSSQELVFESFDGLLIATGNRRVWKPSAYVGTYGDLSNRQVQTYLRNWRRTTT